MLFTALIKGVSSCGIEKFRPVTITVTSPEGLQEQLPEKCLHFIFFNYLITMLVAMTDPFVIFSIVWLILAINVGISGDVRFE